MITYKTIHKVYLDGKLIGEIRQVDGDKWQYFPKGQKKGGDIYKSLLAIKSDLEAE